MTQVPRLFTLAASLVGVAKFFAMGEPQLTIRDYLRHSNLHASFRSRTMKVRSWCHATFQLDSSAICLGSIAEEAVAEHGTD